MLRAQLRETPSIIRRLTRNYGQKQHTMREGEGKWTPFNVVRHVINDSSHINQIVRTLAFHNKSSGGLWIQYLSVLNS